jgi:fluoroquinolone transport system permease protein
MRRFLSLSMADLRNILRDEMLSPFFMFAPIAIFMGARLLIPWLCGQLPVLLPYADLMVMFIGLQAATIYGFIMGSVTLDEKDEQVIPVLRMLPVKPSWFVVNRMMIAITMTFLFMLVYFSFNGTLQLNFPEILLVAFFFSLTSTLIMLPSATFARNKVEGFALFKVVNFLMVLPILSFFIPQQWQYIFWIFPNYWSFQIFKLATTGSVELYVVMGAIITHALAIGLMVKTFVKKVF